jgi:DtxR family Mn-dependent transcriptional regulator
MRSRLMNKKITSNIEDYLEAIYLIEEARGVARVNEIAKSLKVSYPSTSVILKKLHDMGLVVHEKYGYIRLTPAGKIIASDTFEKHQTLSEFFSSVLGINKEAAEFDACKVEHSVSDHLLNQLIKFIQYIQICSKEELGCLQRFNAFVESEKSLPEKRGKKRSGENQGDQIPS